jgi:hypothetical protein
MTESAMANNDVNEWKNKFNRAWGFHVDMDPTTRQAMTVKSQK